VYNQASISLILFIAVFTHEQQQQQHTGSAMKECASKHQSNIIEKGKKKCFQRVKMTKGFVDSLRGNIQIVTMGEAKKNIISERHGAEELELIKKKLS
jgi:hypothetical protein